MAIKEKGWSFKPIEVICFTHYHADHISGLPGLLLTLGNAQRTEPLLMVGPRGLERVVNSLRVIAPDLPFPIVFHELKEKEEVLDVCGCRITAFRVNHNITCYGYTIEIDRAGKFDVNKAKKNNVEMQYWNRLQKGETIELPDRTLTSDLVLGPSRKGIKCTYTTDTRPTDSIVEHAKDADLFICEGMYGEPEKKAKAVEYKHMTFYEAAEPYLKKAITKDLDLRRIAEMVKTRIEIFPDIAEHVDFFEEVPEYDISMYAHKKMKTSPESSLEVLKDILPRLEAQEDYSNDALYAMLCEYVKEKEYKNGYVMWPIRTAVSGKQMTPGGATELMEVLGKEESISRIKAAIEKLEKEL